MRRLGIFLLLTALTWPLQAFAESKAERQQARQQAAISRMAARSRPAAPQPRQPAAMPSARRSLPPQSAIRSQGVVRSGRVLDPDHAQPLRQRVYDQPRVQRDFPRPAPVINTVAAVDQPAAAVKPRVDRRDRDQTDRMRDFVNRNRGGRNRGVDSVPVPSPNVGGQTGVIDSGSVTSPTGDQNEGGRRWDGHRDRDGDGHHRGDRHRNWHERHEGDPDFKRKHRRWHNRDWWRRNYTRFVLFGGGYYYWNRGYWYPAYGYDPYFSTYTYEAPLYGYNGLPPGEIISLVQAKLQQLGYYNAEVDGSFGPLTQQAIMDFQADRGLPVTGEIDQETLNALDFE